MEEIAALVIRAAAKDGIRDDRLRAFGELVQRFQDMAFGYAYSVLGDFHLAEDAAQEAFVTTYQQLDKLRDPSAFAGWLRQIVRTACNRLLRHAEAATTPLESAESVVAKESGPAQQVEKIEMRDEVLAAIQSLSEPERTATTLFYINGYSQKDIAQFLEVSAPTVNNRLRTSRKQLKERMIKMVEETLHKNAPDERFSKKVIEKLLGRPRLLDIDDHPVRNILDTIRVALPDYEFIEGEEIIQESALLPGAPGTDVYHVDEDRILRTATDITTVRAMPGRTPPVRLLTAGRVFRHRKKPEDADHLRVFHQLDLLCIEAGANPEDMKSELQKSIEAVLGPLEVRWDQANFRYFEQCLEVTVKERGKWTELGGCGMIPPHRLQEAGYDPEVVSGFAFGIGRARLAMLNYSVDNFPQLLRP